MNILQAHKYYWHRDGASNYALYLSELLEQAGHKVVPFAMAHEDNLKSKYEKFFVSKIKLDDPKKVSLIKKLKYAGRMFYSLEAKKKMRALLEQEKIDVVHLHNIYHHISPSILPVIKKKGIPVVMTLHDYKLICPNYTMFHHGQVHEEDCRGWYGSCVKNKCMKDSRLQSRIVRWEMVFHHKIMKYYERYVDKFIAPSEFIMKKCIEHGWPKDKFVHIPHPIDLSKYSVHSDDKGYGAYTGRLSEEKGLEVLLEAAAKLPDVPFKIIGGGPMLESLKSEVLSRKLKNVDFTGFKTGQALQKLLQNARLFVVPSIWYENYPLSILEPKAMGKVVIGSKIGGIPELLPKDLLAKPGDADELAKKIKFWYEKPLAERQKVGGKFRKEVEELNDPDIHLGGILEVYKKCD